MQRPQPSSPRQTRFPAKTDPRASGIKEPLQVRIPQDVKRRFKARAAMRGIDPHELFVEVWEHYERTGS